VEWTREGDVFSAVDSDDPDSLRAWQPWVIEDDDDTLRMWYAGHDESTGRILAATKQPDHGWHRLGVAVDAGLAGDSDRYGVESPCVVKVPAGYLMAYGGSDGEHTRLHMATSGDGRRWIGHGSVIQRGQEDALAASDPCLFISGERWWLFFSGCDGANQGRRTAILAAVSQSGASWDRVGPVLVPEQGELAVRHPCVLEIAHRFHMFYASETDEHLTIALATSPDGLDWERRGIVLTTTGDRADAVDTPCVVRLRDGSLRMWYAVRPRGDTRLAYRISAAAFPGPWPGRDH